jgi:uncharacterized protein (DUF58 family)
MSAAGAPSATVPAASARGLAAAAGAVAPSAERAAGAALGPVRQVLSWQLGTLIMVLVFMLVAAINYQSNAAWLLVWLCAAGALLSTRHARRNLRTVSLADWNAAPVFAGEPIRLGVTLAAGRHDAWGIAVSAPDEPIETSASTGERIATCNLPALGAAALAIPLAPRPRGRWRIDRLIVCSAWPLGLATVWREMPVDCAVLVYPAPLGRGLEALAGEDEGDGSGDGPGHEDFIGHRSLRPGEQPRRIDWKAHARGRPLLAKEFAGGGGSGVWCDWDRTQGDVEARLSQLARWVVDAHRGGQAFALRLPGVAVPPGSGEAHCHQCLAALAVYGRSEP